MAETYTWEDLLAVLQRANPIKASALHTSRRRSEHGLLSVGLKLHCLNPEYPELQKLVEAVGGFEQRPYRNKQASLTYILPPVGSARMAVMLLECIEEFTGFPLFNNPMVQIQVCSPCRLEPEYAAIFAVVFYLGSDVLRRYKIRELETTFSNDSGHLTRGRRIVLYDGHGDLDRGFEWWDLDRDRLAVRRTLPFKNERTDILTGQTKRDIFNVNLAATLLVHHQQIAYWEDLGGLFKKEVEELLKEHELHGVLSGMWVHEEEQGEKVDDMQFIVPFADLINYAFAEKERLKRSRLMFWRKPEPEKGILWQMNGLLEKYRSMLIERAQELAQGGEE